VSSKNAGSSIARRYSSVVRRYVSEKMAPADPNRAFSGQRHGYHTFHPQEAAHGRPRRPGPLPPPRYPRRNTRMLARSSENVSRYVPAKPWGRALEVRRNRSTRDCTWPKHVRRLMISAHTGW
jgi:hypothetical protein